MSDHAELIARLETAETGHYGLDDAVWVGLGLILAHPNGAHTRLPRVTTSLDAALALAERAGLEPVMVLESAIYHARRHGPIPTTAAKVTRYACIAILRASPTTVNNKGET